MNTYQELISAFARLVQAGKACPLGGWPSTSCPGIPPDAPKVLVFSPHPDDECVTGALALRLLREAQMNVVNVAITQGSNKARQMERLAELQAACAHLGFGVVQTRPAGLERINPRTRKEEPGSWQPMVRIIQDILRQHLPRVILLPHERDWNSTHIGSHYLVMDALRGLGTSLECYLVETEFWGQMDDPNLMVEVSETDLADLVAGISFHVGEVRRNPYHVLLPPWMLDNVRRGSELVGGQGQGAPDMMFAILYRLTCWRQGNVERFYQGGRLLPAGVNARTIFD